MANVFIQDSTMAAIGDAIRAKTGGTAKILPADMATEIAAIETGSDIQLIEGMEIPLDFSAGDQSLAAPDGQAVKSATIKKPTTLVPENIADGVDIAGVVGTLESGGSGDGDTVNVSGVTENAGYLGITGFLFDGATTKTQTPYTEIPEDAILNGAILHLAYTKYASDLNTVTGTSDDVVCDSVNGIEETSLGNGRKRVSFSPMTFTGLSQYANKVAGSANVTYTMPNVSYENGILRCNADCKSLFGLLSPTILLREIDMRGSQVKEFNSSFKLIDTSRNECCFRKIYFSEVFSKLTSSLLTGAKWLEEIHFTSTTPPTAASGWYSNIPTTCKIYVPTGYLSTYTSASNYPDPATYTYIEE